MNQESKEKSKEALESKIKLLNDSIWEQRVPHVALAEWIAQFNAAEDIQSDEQYHALFLASHFLYFGQREIRALLRALYRDHIRAPALRQIRADMGSQCELELLYRKYYSNEKKIKFLGIGNPSESSTHLLYYFRQENRLSKELFIHPHQMFRHSYTDRRREFTIRHSEVERYIFLDDMCGSGVQAEAYAEDLVRPMRAAKKDVSVEYYVLFGNFEGMNKIRGLGAFDSVEAVCELDESFKALEDASRVFTGSEELNRQGVRETCLRYGRRLYPQFPLGFENGQLLLGFSHNTPDNTLPIFWGGQEAEQGPWRALFRRYGKVD